MFKCKSVIQSILKTLRNITIWTLGTDDKSLKINRLANQSGSDCKIATEVHDMFTLLSILSVKPQEYFNC